MTISEIRFGATHYCQLNFLTTTKFGRRLINTEFGDREGIYICGLAIFESESDVNFFCSS